MRQPRIVAWLLALAACGEPAADELRVEPLATPAARGSGQPSLAVDSDGRALLTWLVQAPDSGAVLRMATLEDTIWSQPLTVAEGRDFIVNWADFPSALHLEGERLVVHWLEREGTDTYAYGVRLSFSDDGGSTWSAPVRPHSDSTGTEHGFVSMLPADDGAVDAVWLDGRNFAAGLPEMTLRSARVGPTAIRDSALLDERICDCCQTDAARTSDGMIVVYRDRSPGEIRDIAVVRRVDGRWSEPRTVHDDGWRIDGCPVNGPAVAAAGERIAVAWFTAARDTAKVLLAFSRDGGATFDAPVRVDDGEPVGRVDVVMLDDDSAIVSWIEEVGEGGELRLRRVSLDRGAGSATTVARLAASRASGFPRLALAGTSLLIAWTDVEAGRVSAARVASP